MLRACQGVTLGAAPKEFSTDMQDVSDTTSLQWDKPKVASLWHLYSGLPLFTRIHKSG